MTMLIHRRFACPSQGLFQPPAGRWLALSNIVLGKSHVNATSDRCEVPGYLEAGCSSLIVYRFLVKICANSLMKADVQCRQCFICYDEGLMVVGVSLAFKCL